MSLNYEELVESLKTNKEKNFEKLYLKMHTPLKFFIFNFVKNKEASEDIAADTLSTAYEKFDSYDSEMSELNTWIYAIAKNKCLNYLRVNESTVSIEDEIADSLLLKDTLEYSKSPYNEEKIQVLYSELVNVINSNDKTGINSEILRYKYFENLSSSEIAKRINQKHITTYQDLKKKCSENTNDKSLYMELLIKTENFARDRFITESQVKSKLKKTHSLLRSYFKETDLRDLINI